MRKVSMLVLFFLSIFLSVNQCSAQLIDYNRRSKKTQNITPPETQSKPEAIKVAVPKNVSKKGNMKQEVQDWEREVVNLNRVERLYDYNSDDDLSVSEKKEFFTDVISKVDEDGFAQVNSDLLNEFDKDEDGKISRYEAWSLKRAAK